MVGGILMEQVMICGVQTIEKDEVFQASMEELKRLVETARGEVVETIIQKRPTIDTKTVVGKGKLQEMKGIVSSQSIETVIFNQSLTPRQSQNLEDYLEVKVIDRTQLILDIFAMRARSKAGKLQVELAQIDYLLPRLSGSSSHLSRQGGGIGTRGPGETKLETDRRHLQKKRTKIKEELKAVKNQRALNRKQRLKKGQLQLGLIGYTNAGKSTLINTMTHANTYEKDELFATLDPLTKRYTLQSGMQVNITDTVGFIQDLPTTLIEAFQSTLEESRHMDILLHVIDASSPFRSYQEQTVQSLIKELSLEKIPTLVVYNKIDLATDFTPTLFPFVTISAKNTQCLEVLEEGINKMLEEMWEPYQLTLPIQQGYQIEKLKQTTYLKSSIFNEEDEQYEITGFKSKDRPLSL